jgi:hypothetical protein
MPQRTRATVAGRVWTFASRTGDQASRMIAVVVPQRTHTRASSNGFARMMARTKRTARTGPARGWWVNMTRRLPGRRTTRRARRIALWTPVAFGAARAWMLMRRNAGRLRERRQMWTSRVAFRAGRAVGATTGARGMARVSESRAARKAQATMKRARGAGRTFALTVRTRGRTRLRRGWRRIRFFTIGFSIGAIWAYLFAPRQGPAYERMQQASQRSRTA